MTRFSKDLGGHAGFPPRALTKAEVAAALCYAGHQAGFWSIPEFEIHGQGGVCRRVDVVWASRQSPDAGHLWRPVAAFEIEGHRVAVGSLKKNVDSLQAAASRGATIRAMILFQVGPNGRPWGNASAATSVSRAEHYLQQFKAECGSDAAIQIILDEQLADSLGSWTDSIASQVRTAQQADSRVD
jgi:hypothetical protein